MAKKSKLLSKTDPLSLKNVSIGSILAVFVFLGSFIVGDSISYQVYGYSTLLACPTCTTVTDDQGRTTIRATPSPSSPANIDRWPGPTEYTRDWRDGKWYQNADYDKNGKVTQDEILRWNQEHHPISNQPRNLERGPGGGGAGTTRTSQSPLQTENAYMGGGCLSANPEDCY